MVHRFVIRHNDLRRRTAIAGFPTEAFEDVTVDFGPVRPNDTYLVMMVSENVRSLDQATVLFRNLATAQRAIVTDNRSEI